MMEDMEHEFHIRAAIITALSQWLDKCPVRFGMVEDIEHKFHIRATIITG
jgi:hypothetical protein